MIRAIKTVRPENFEHVVAILALFRPGPMEFIQTFADRKDQKGISGAHQARVSLFWQVRRL